MKVLRPINDNNPKATHARPLAPIHPCTHITHIDLLVRNVIALERALAGAGGGGGLSGWVVGGWVGGDERRSSGRGGRMPATRLSIPALQPPSLLLTILLTMSNTPTTAVPCVPRNLAGSLHTRESQHAGTQMY